MLNRLIKTHCTTCVQCTSLIPRPPHTDIHVVRREELAIHYFRIYIKSPGKHQCQLGYSYFHVLGIQRILNMQPRGRTRMNGFKLFFPASSQSKCSCKFQSLVIVCQIKVGCNAHKRCRYSSLVLDHVWCMEIIILLQFTNSLQEPRMESFQQYLDHHVFMV